MSKPTFEEWIKDVDVILTEKVGMDSMTLPDFSWWDHWDDNVTPVAAVDDYVEYEFGW